MSVDQGIEDYLGRLDKALGPIATSDRADIITEIKSHILEARKKSPRRSLSSILESFGEPENVANRYLMERGLKAGKPSKTPVVKWLTTGIVGTVALVCLLVAFLVWHFTPLISIDGEKSRITLLGGAINLNGGTGEVKIGSSTFGKTASQAFAGDQALEPGQTDTVEVLFVTGDVALRPSPDGKLHWKFEVAGAPGKATAMKDGRTFVIKMDETSGVDGEVQFPERMKLRVKGVTGDIAVVKPGAATEISLVTGDIKIAPDPVKKYRYETHITTGDIASFESSDSKDAIPVKATLTTGDISKE